MEKSIKITLIICTAVIILAVLGIYAFKSGSATEVTTTGNAEIKAMPDLVTIYFNVQTKGDTAQEAKDKNSEIVDSATIALLKTGLERSEITTENYNIYPDYDWTSGSQKLKGYIATHSIKVQLDSEKLDDAGEIIDAGVNAGATISYINFELSLDKQNEYKAIALKQATEDAKIKAESIASGAGKKLGALVSIADSSFNYYPWPLYEAQAESASTADAKSAVTSIQPGEQTISASVSATYKIR